MGECSICHEIVFQEELSTPENYPELRVCQDCLSGILIGTIQIDEQLLG